MRVPSRPWFWFLAFAIWFGTLWWLSSTVHATPPSLDFQASDKVLHFGWFLGGAGLLSAALHTWRPEAPSRQRILVTIAIVTLVGVIDEYHQSKVPGRHGNDPYDLTADFLGAVGGAFSFGPFRRFFRKAV